MGSWRELLFFHLILVNIVSTLTVSQPDFLYSTNISESGNYSTNSTYQKNLVALLSSLSNSTDRYGFCSSSVGENPDRVYAIVLCRGDVDLDSCRSCINDATMKLPQLLPNYKAAIGWYDLCMLRYSDKSIYGIEASSPPFFSGNQATAWSVNEFNQAVKSLLDGLRSQAASGGARRKFATNNKTGPDFQPIYGLMQCTPDLTQRDCNNCLGWATGQIPQHFGGKIGGRFLTPTCALRYESYHFFTDIRADAPPDAPAEAPPTTSGDAPPDAPAEAPPTTSAYAMCFYNTEFLGFAGKKDNTTRTIIISAVLTIISVIGLIVCICIFLRKRKQKKKPKQKVEGNGYMAPEYAMRGQFSVKSDVFSFGVLVLEILSGQRNNSFRNGENIEDLLSYAWKTWREGTSSNLIDPVLRDNSGSMWEMIRCIHIGLLCIQENVAERPTIASVVLMLSSSSLNLPVPSEPAAFLRSGNTNSELPLLQEHGHEMAVLDHSTNEVSITELDPR
ncbi:hypothetical protein RHSIM_Rhsim07G0196200 [Rhododendron simsii]|uniref:Gnk2-homologous domain-containing protein n=1 Tax=Rhododendron simsii TaxID=118357 RepID=A0A834GN89_RHOSS|nr:hypothetical protein RHSIM_Rhsim07G0196200 [Rhododendron simsii]